MGRTPNRLPNYAAISSGAIGPIPYGYAIYKDGVDIIGFNSITGVTIATDTEIGVVANACIADMVLGGVIQILPGDYNMTTAIVGGAKTVMLEGGAYLADTNPGTTAVTNIEVQNAIGATYAINLGDVSKNMHGGGVRNLVIDAQGRTTMLGAIYGTNQNFPIYENLYINRFQKTGANGYGINLEVTGGQWGYMPTIKDVHTYQCTNGLRIGPLVHGAMVIGGQFVGRSSTQTTGIIIEGCDTPTFIGPVDIEINSHADGIGIHFLSGMYGSFHGFRCEGNMKDIVIDAGAGQGAHKFFGGNLYSAVVGWVPVTDNGGLPSKFYGVGGYLTENWGTSTGTGAEQAIAHGLSATPTLVLLSDKELNAIPYQSSAAAADHIHITAAVNQDYSWYAKV